MDHVLVGWDIQHDIQQRGKDDAVGQQGNDLSPFHDVGDWQTNYRASFFPFGDNSFRGQDTNTSNCSLNMTGMLFQHT